MATASVIRHAAHNGPLPALCCPSCGAFVDLGAQCARCQCGKNFNWDGRVLDCAAKDEFYEGKYNADIHFSTARMESPGGKLLLHFLVYGYYEAILRYVPAGSTVLDMGCAGGSALLAERGRVVGLDVSLRAAKVAAGKYACAIRGDIRKLDFSPESFDAIVSSFVWEHMRPAEKDFLLQKFRSWLRPGGRVVLLFDVESRNPLFEWARQHPEQYRKGFIEHDGHFGLEPATAALERFTRQGFDLIWKHAFNRTPIQHLPVWGWMGAFGDTYPTARLVSSLGKRIAENRIANRAYTGSVQVLDDTLGRIFPLDWSRLMMVVLEKPAQV